jgi:broad specificity polyphosphatase/5'/3'-nucleotidase SurE
VDIPNLCSNRFEKALLLNINNDPKPRMVCSQEWEKGIECLHIKFTLAEDVFESRMTQKQRENVEYMFESRMTQMQEGENDENITNMDTSSVVAYDSKVKLFLSIIIFNTCDE